MEILRALKGGTAALNAIHSEMSIDDVERLLEESNEAIEVRRQQNAPLFIALLA